MSLPRLHYARSQTAGVSERSVALCLHVSPIVSATRTSNARHGAPDAVVVAHQTAHASCASIHPASPLHSEVHSAPPSVRAFHNSQRHAVVTLTSARVRARFPAAAKPFLRSEEHTSELQSLRHLVCRL